MAGARPFSAGTLLHREIRAGEIGLRANNKSLWSLAMQADHARPARGSAFYFLSALCEDSTGND
jgi:hypothetical protein